MGTRADFYANHNGAAEWLGSIAWDGYPSGLSDALLAAGSHDEYLVAVKQLFDERDDVTRPAQGWPWPWEDSWTSDYAYTWNDGKVIWTIGDHGWTDKEPETDEEYNSYRVPAPFEFPNMKDRQRVTLGPRNGVIVVGG